MKVSRATVRLYLKTAKKLSDGRNPIMLRVCWHGFKDVSTHYSAFIREWDKRNECVKSCCPNSVMVNHQLNELKNKVIQKRDNYIKDGIEYTVNMLLSFDDDIEKKDSNIVVELISQYYKEKELRGSTVIGWKYDITLLNEYHPNLIISEITEGWCKRYGKWLEVNKGLCEGTVRTRLGHIACIYRYAAGKGLCDMIRYPYRDWNYCNEYHLSEKVEYIHSKSIDVIKDYFLSKVIRMTSENMFTYVDDGYISYKNRLFVIYFWLLGYMLQGLSPIDICLLKKEDFKRIVVDGEEYWSIDTSRLKTGVKVKIRIKVHTIYSQVMIWRMMMEGDEWFLPIMHGLSGDDIEKCKQRMRSVMSYWMNSKLSDWWREINQIIIQKNVTEGTDIPLIDEGCTYYSYRHSFAQTYMARGGYPMALATLMGRSVNTLSVYLEQLSQNDDLVEAVSVMED